jgi:hypothetical protein
MLLMLAGLLLAAVINMRVIRMDVVSFPMPNKDSLDIHGL